MPLSFSSGGNKALGFAGAIPILASGAVYSFVSSPFGANSVYNPMVPVPPVLLETSNNLNAQSFVFYVHGSGAGIRPLYWTIKHITTTAMDFGATSGLFDSNNWGLTAYPSPGSWYNNPYGEELGRFGIYTISENVTEGTETFQIEIREASYTGPIVLTSPVISIADTSAPATFSFDTVWNNAVTQNNLREGTTYEFRVKGINLSTGEEYPVIAPDGHYVYYSIDNTTINYNYPSSQYYTYAFNKDEGTQWSQVLSAGKIYVKNAEYFDNVTRPGYGSPTNTTRKETYGSGKFYIQPRNDGITEGPTTHTIQLREAYAEGPIIGTYTFTINEPPPTYFIAHLSNAIGKDVAVASSGNIYVVGNVSAFALIAKYNSSGTLQWQKSLGEISPAEEGWGIAIDSSENVYITGYTQSNGSSIVSAPYTQYNNVIIVKCNTNGTIQWQKQLSGGTSRNEYGVGIAVDSDSNIYVSAYSNANAGGGNFDFLTFKLDSSGNMSWQRSLSGTGFSGTSSDFGVGIALDSASNVYITGYSDNNGTYDLVLAKYNNSGTLQWQRVLGNNSWSTSDTGNNLAVDSANNIYVTGLANQVEVLVVKYNSSGALQWQRSLAGSVSIGGTGIAVDSSNNVYITANSNTSGADDIFTAKYNSDGTLQWQRKLSTTGSDRCSNITLDSSGSMYNIGYTDVSSVGSLLLTKFPGDGTLTGTYSLGGSTYTYAESALTPATSTLVDSIGTLSEATSYLTLSDIVLPDAAGTGTPTVITF